MTDDNFIIMVVSRSNLETASPSSPVQTRKHIPQGREWSSILEAGVKAEREKTMRWMLSRKSGVEAEGEKQKKQLRHKGIEAVVERRRMW